MIKPDCIDRILYSNEPDKIAREVIDLLLRAVEPGFKESNEYDEILDRLYLKLDHYRNGRDRYIAERTGAAA